jgi:hypothetical protein
MAGESAYARTAETADMAAAETADMTAAETADVAAAKATSVATPAAVTASSMLRPERDSEKKGDRRNGDQATHTIKIVCSSDASFKRFIR